MMMLFRAVCPVVRHTVVSDDMFAAYEAVILAFAIHVAVAVAVAVTRAVAFTAA
jgi:hypothetical protein